MTDGQNIKVFVRCRPLKSDETQAVFDLDSHRQVVTVETQNKENKEFSFDSVFGTGAHQEDVYEAVVKPLIPQVLQGYDCAVLAYGQTGTGKTYTMEGDPDGIGIIPRAVNQIFALLRQTVQEFNVNVSFLELYSEDAYDLLSSPEDTSKLRIFDDKKDDRKKSVKIEGLREISVESETDIIELLARGSQKRQTAATLLNACSSRSHSIFTITVRVKTEIQDEREIIRIGKLNLVDLAGSESIARSGAQNKHAREAGNINQSLLTLTRVITALAEKRPHVPYRESKLTRILQDSLGGATRTSMIATISPANADLGNTLGTLEYAARTRRIKNRPECNRQLSNRKTSEDLEEYKKCFEAEIEARIRSEVVRDYRAEITKAESQFKKVLDEKSAVIRELNDKNVDLNSELESLNRELKIVKFMVKDKEQLLENLRIDFKKREDEFKEKEVEFKQRELEFKQREYEMESRLENQHRPPPVKEESPLSPIPTPKPPKRTAKLSKRPPVQDDDYANLTFTGDDEIAQVSAVKKPRKAIPAEPKLRQDLTMSGRKKKLKNYGGDIDLSPISPPVRVTRSRNTRRKLQY